jgi:hypothetical protein
MTGSGFVTSETPGAVVCRGTSAQYYMYMCLHAIHGCGCEVWLGHGQELPTVAPVCDRVMACPVTAA